METTASNGEISFSVALSNLTNIAMTTFQQYQAEIQSLKDQLKVVTSELSNLRTENDALHSQLNQSEPNPLDEK